MTTRKASDSIVLDVVDLTTDYVSGARLFGKREALHVLRDISFQAERGKTLGLVGESGCGKTTLLLSLLGLTPVRRGMVLIDGSDLMTARGKDLRTLRTKIQIVFQNPYSSLNPKMTVEQLIGEPLRLQLPRQERQARVLELMDDVGLKARYSSSYSYQLSGGQAQRVAIARSLASQPEVLVLDEPTSALDVSIQAQVLNLLLSLQEEFGLTYILSSHDLRVIEHMSDRIAVMYLGEIIELSSVQQLFAEPLHPYTQALLKASIAGKGDAMLGSVPSFSHPPEGCRFHPRCPAAKAVCHKQTPITLSAEGARLVHCHLYDDGMSMEMQ